MVTQVRKDYRSDEGLLSLMGLLKVDGIKIGGWIHCFSGLWPKPSQDQKSIAHPSVGE